jgi:hypothetical protein
VSTTGRASDLQPQDAPRDTATSRLARRDTATSRLALDPNGFEAHERDQMLDRLRNLRRVLPVLAQEMAAARRQAARLRRDNRRLSEQVRQLRATLEAREHRPA